LADLSLTHQRDRCAAYGSWLRVADSAPIPRVDPAGGAKWPIHRPVRLVVMRSTAA
jgi:hypothetical protein